MTLHAVSFKTPVNTCAHERVQGLGNNRLPFHSSLCCRFAAAKLLKGGLLGSDHNEKSPIM